MVFFIIGEKRNTNNIVKYFHLSLTNIQYLPTFAVFTNMMKKPASRVVHLLTDLSTTWSILHFNTHHSIIPTHRLIVRRKGVMCETRVLLRTAFVSNPYKRLTRERYPTRKLKKITNLPELYKKCRNKYKAICLFLKQEFTELIIF